MNLRECMLLLPGYGLDDFPRTLDSQQADELLAGWVALWHPQLINACRTTPRWQQATYPPAETSDLLMVLPSVSQPSLRSGFQEEVTSNGGLLVAARAPWKEFQSELLAAVGLAEGGVTVDELNHDFAALGYAFLQVQLMTRQLRYTSNLDELLFSDQALQAAQAALADDRETAARMLQSCFDQLGQERDHYYSLDVKLIDVTLLAPTTLGASLQKQLAKSDPPTSLIASASLVRTIKDSQPESMHAISASLTERKAVLVGGLEGERPHPLMTADAVRRDLARGRTAYEQLGVPFPKVFSRYSFGAVADMPLHLRRSGFIGALLVAWERGTYPQGSQAKISWEASDGTFLPTLTPKVIDAADPASYLTLGLKTGEALDREQVPALVFAHWPNRLCDYFQLLVTITKRTPALGKWSLVDEFFENTDPSYHQEQLAANQFRHDWLNSARPFSAAELLTRTKAYDRLQTQANSLQNLANLLYQLEHYHKVPKQSSEVANETNTPVYRAADLAAWLPQLFDLWNRIDALFDAASDASNVSSQTAIIEADLNLLADDLLMRLAKQLAPGSVPTKTGAASNLRLVLNPYSCATRLPVVANAKQMVAPETSCVFAAGQAPDGQVTLCDLPQFGFVAAAVSDAAVSKSRQRGLAENSGLLQNEFLEAQIDPERGHLLSLHAPGKRGNRFSFSVARRELNGKQPNYSEMQADRTETLINSSVRGSMRTTGRLTNQGVVVGKFQVDYSVWRGSRVLDVTVRLSELKSMEADPWKSACVLRCAWPTEAAILRIFPVGGRESFSGGSAVAPQLIEIDEAEYRTHLLTGGLAFHRRIESRFLETLLAVQGQTEVTHRFGIAVDLPYPQHAASQFVDRSYEVNLTSPSPVQNRSSWLVNVDAKNAKLDLESPLVNANGQLIGQRMRLCETEGKLANAKIRCSRDAYEAYRVDNLGGRIGKLTVAGDTCTISLRANERVLVDVLWKA